jgi:hypothetical protein
VAESAHRVHPFSMKLLVDEVQLGEIAKPAADAAIRQAIAFLSQTLAPASAAGSEGWPVPARTGRPFAALTRQGDTS